jgi:hypothetical protein
MQELSYNVNNMQEMYAMNEGAIAELGRLIRKFSKKKIYI